MPPPPKKRKLQKRGTIHKIRLKNFMSYDNASFKPGEKFNVIIGPNGSGKSTILDLIGRLYDVQDGQIGTQMANAAFRSFDLAPIVATWAAKMTYLALPTDSTRIA